MLLAIDVGNTNITAAVYNGETVVVDWRLSTRTERTADEYAALFAPLFDRAGVKFAEIKCVGISSVVPRSLEGLLAFAREYLSTQPVVLSHTLDMGIQVKYHPPSDVGPDRLANAFAAHRKYPGSVIVIDFGTATTLDAISAEGVYLGGAIAPGIAVSLDALFSHAARLTGVALEAPDKAIGDTTAGSLQSGIIFGFAGQVDALADRFKAEMEGDVMVVATGGLASVIAPHSRTIQHCDELLTLEGIRLTCERVCKKSQRSE